MMGDLKRIEVTVPRREGIAETMERVAAFLPSNYTVSRWKWAEDEDEVRAWGAAVIIVVGEDYAGWTAEDYVLPRLASGLLFGKVVD